MQISLNLKKSFLGFLSVHLLRQHVDSLGLTSADDKLQAIAQIEFPATLAKLEYFLSLTGWLCQYIPFYAALAEPLQNRKTALLCKSPVSGQACCNYLLSVKVLDPTSLETAAFQELKSIFRSSTFLIHYNHTCTTYINVDSSQKFRMRAMIYHVKKGIDLQPRQ